MPSPSRIGSAFVFLAAACSGERNAGPSGLLGEQGSEEVIIGEAVVKDVEVSATSREQVEAVARGELPDGCTNVHEMELSRVDDEFTVHITTVRPRDASCTGEIRPFDKAILLDVKGLPSGRYRLTVNGVSVSFTV